MTTRNAVIQIISLWLLGVLIGLATPATWAYISRTPLPTSQELQDYLKD